MCAQASDPVADAGRRRPDRLQRQAQRPGQDRPRAGVVRRARRRRRRRRRCSSVSTIAEDQAEDDEGVARQRQPGGPHDRPADGEVADRDQHEPDRRGSRRAMTRLQQQPAEAASARTALDQPVGDVVAGRGQQDDEAPEDEGVRQPGAEVLEQALLAEDEDAERPDPLARRSVRSSGRPWRSTARCQRARRQNRTIAAATGHDDQRDRTGWWLPCVGRHGSRGSMAREALSIGFAGREPGRCRQQLYHY